MRITKIIRTGFLASAGMVLTLATAAAQEPTAQDTAAAPDSVVLEAPPPARFVQDTTATGELRALFSRIEALAEIEVDVEGGVATLTGRALTQEAKETAERLAGERPEVVYVDDRVLVETSVGARIGPVVDDLRHTALDWIARLPLFIAALGLVVVFAVIAEVVSSWRWLYSRFAETSFTRDLVRRAIRLVVWVAGLVLALQLIDATALVGALLGAAGVAGLAFGFAFRNIAENWLAGVLLGVRRPFDLDDLVLVGGAEGRVVRLTHSDTVLMTPDGNHLRIPNAVVFNGMVENFTRNPLRRMRFKLTLPRDVDVDGARQVILGSLAATPVLQSPAPAAPLLEVGDATLVLELQAWVDQSENDFLRARSIVYKTAKDALLAAGIASPSSEHWVHMDTVETQASATEAKSELGSAAADVPTESAEPDDAIDQQVAVDRERSGDVNLLG